MPRRATWHEHSRDTERKIIFIIDDCWGNYLSITNDAEEVLRYHMITLGKDWRVVYQDTEGEWWEIKYASGFSTGVWRVVFEPWDGLAWDILKRATS